MYVYNTKMTCSSQIKITQGVARLAEGRNIDEVIALLKGIQCRGGTSCPDQLARALEEIKQKRSA